MQLASPADCRILPKNRVEQAECRKENVTRGPLLLIRASVECRKQPAELGWPQCAQYSRFQHGQHGTGGHSPGTGA